MGRLLASLLVTALLIAVNPGPILVGVTLRTSNHGKRSVAVATIYAATLVVVMATVGLLTVFLLGQAGSSSQKSGSMASAVLQLAFGLGFLGIAALQWRARPSDQPPGWMRAMDKAGFIVAVILGVSMINYALLTSGSTDILKSHLTPAQDVAGLVFFIAVATSTVAAPLVISVVRPAWADRELKRFRGWLTRHNRVLIIAIFGLMGLLFSAQGIAHLVG